MAESSSRFRVKSAALGGEGVDRGAEDVAVEDEGIRPVRAGVENPEAKEPSERSGGENPD